MNPRRLLVPTVLVLALVALLALAASAAAEVRTGEGTSPVDESIAGELDLIGASAAYDSSTGTVFVTETTRSAPQVGSENWVEAAFFTSPTGTCTLADARGGAYPVILLRTFYDEPTAVWVALAAENEMEPPENPAAKSVSGTTTTLSAATAQAVGLSYNCLLVGTGGSGLGPADYIGFPIAVPQPASPVTTPTQSSTPADSPPPPPTPTPAAFSFAKARQLKLKEGKWATVKINVTNTGGTVTVPGSLRLTAPRGILIKAPRQKLPALLPGGSWKVPFRIKLTEKAKPKSTLTLTGTAGSVLTTSSLVVKLLGG